MWAQYNTPYWTNLPARPGRRQFTPSTWNGYLNMTGIDALARLKARSEDSPRAPRRCSRTATRRRRPGAALASPPSTPRTHVSRYLLRKLLLYVLTFVVAVTVDWAIPRLHAR